MRTLTYATPAGTSRCSKYSPASTGWNSVRKGDQYRSAPGTRVSCFSARTSPLGVRKMKCSAIETVGVCPLEERGFNSIWCTKPGLFTGNGNSLIIDPSGLTRPVAVVSKSGGSDQPNMCEAIFNPKPIIGNAAIITAKTFNLGCRKRIATYQS